MENKPDIVAIFTHANSNVPWGFAPFWIGREYGIFCNETGSPSNLYNEKLQKFTDWLLEKYWPDWRDSENG